jgi:hypothetical protein
VAFFFRGAFLRAVFLRAAFFREVFFLAAMGSSRSGSTLFGFYWSLLRRVNESRDRRSRTSLYACR